MHMYFTVLATNTGPTRDFKMFFTARELCQWRPGVAKSSIQSSGIYVVPMSVHQFTVKAILTTNLGRVGRPTFQKTKGTIPK